MQNTSQLVSKLEKRVRALTFSSNHLGGELKQHLTEGVDVGGRQIRPSHLHIKQLSDQYELRRGGLFLV